MDGDEYKTRVKPLQWSSKL